ncbi:MAG: HD domain-containing protein [Lachnospiraceae bacterium]
MELEADKITELYREMISYYGGDPKRTQHFIKVHSLAKLIGIMEGLPEQELFTLEAAALVHDIGIKAAEEKYGSCNGKLQEQEGPVLAEEMLGRLGFAEEVINRVSYLVGHHHTYTEIDGIDYQILVEADFLVNLYEDAVNPSAIRVTLQNIFRTKSGRQICETMFHIK